MIPVPTGARVWLATGHTDMRRGFPSLALQVQEVLRKEPLSGHLFFRQRLCPTANPMSLQFVDDLTRRSLLHPSASSIAFCVSGSSGRASLTPMSEHIRSHLATRPTPLIHFAAAPPTTIPLVLAPAWLVPRGRAASRKLRAMPTIAPPRGASRHLRSWASGRSHPRAAWRTYRGPFSRRTPA